MRVSEGLFGRVFLTLGLPLDTYSFSGSSVVEMW